MKHIDSLFTPFFRADDSRQRKTGGVGLRLYIKKKIVEAHDGEINIESELNQGTKASIKIPIPIPIQD